MKTEYNYQPETTTEAQRVGVKCVSGAAHARGMFSTEPLIVILDSAIRYAKAYKKRFGPYLQADYVLGPQFLAVLQGVRGLLDGDGAFAMERDLTTDSKDNGACEALFWKALELGGFTEADLK